MADKFPVKLVHPESKKKDKTLSARDQEELERLLRLGWKEKE